MVITKQNSQTQHHHQTKLNQTNQWDTTSFDLFITRAPAIRKQQNTHTHTPTPTPNSRHSPDYKMFSVFVVGSKEESSKSNIIEQKNIRKPKRGYTHITHTHTYIHNTTLMFVPEQRDRQIEHHQPQ